MVKTNRRFSWREAREDEVGFNFVSGNQNGEGSHRNNGDQSDPNDQPQDFGGRGMEILNRNDFGNHRMLANDVLYIAPNEHPGMSLTADLFDGRNFHSWSRAIRRALFARNKLGFIDGTLTEPSDESVDHMQWIKADYIVFNWLCNSVVKELSRGLQNLDTSQQLWDELNKRFGKKNGPRLYKLRREIAAYTQRNLNVMTYFNNLSSLWDDLALLRTARVCCCPAGEDARVEMEEMHMMQFLMGLNDVYEPVRQQILILNPLPTVNEAYSMVLEVEEQMMVSSQFSEGAEQSALYSHQKGKYPGSDANSSKKRLTKEEKMRLICDHCGKSGHLKADCFELNGVPDWYKRFKDIKAKARANYGDERNQVTQVTGHDNGKRAAEADGMGNIGKLIQSEIAKHFATYMSKEGKAESSEGVGKLANLVETDLGIESIDFNGHFAFGISTTIQKDEWVIDSGASNHMSCSAELLTNIRRLKTAIQIYMPNGSSLMAYLVGDAQITGTVKLLNVLYCPEFTHNLLSVGQMARDTKGLATFDDTHCVLKRKGSDAALGVGRMKGTLYIFKHAVKYANVMNADTALTLKELHDVLGHPSITTMKHIECLRKRYREEEYTELECCEVCHRAKQQRNPFPVLSRRTEIVFNTIHVDVWGPCAGPSVTNTPYFLTVVDDSSRATWTFLFSSKAQVWTILRSYILMVRTQFKKEIQVIRSDNGSEFMSKQTQELFADFGIHHQRTCVYTPQQNGIVERKHRHLLQVARSLMFQSQLPSSFWPYSILFATYLINRMPTAVLGWSTPYEQLTGKVPDITESVQEPTSYTEASQNKEWIEAMDRELRALEENHTWEVVKLPEGKKAIGCKWVYKGYEKGSSEGNVCKLIKSLYGLKQASREWNMEFTMQVADLFTKALPGPQFRDLLCKLNLGDLHQLQLEGGCKS